MTTETKYNLGQYYFGIMGLIILGFGFLELLFLLTGGEHSYGILNIPSAPVRGLIVGCMGAFMLAGALKLKSINGLALVTLACIMLWIFAANDLFETATASILPAEEEEPEEVEETAEALEVEEEAIEAAETETLEEEGATWFNTWEGFLETWKGPYNPCIILLPFTLPILLYIRRYKKELSVFEY